MTENPGIEPADWAAALLAIDPGLGGIALRARAGPGREAWLARAVGWLPGSVRVQPGVASDRLFGGLDLAATLAAGKPVHQAGIVAEIGAGCLIVPMAERLAPGTAARLALSRDDGARFTVIALDETAEDEETSPPAALMDRLAFRCALRHRPLAEPEADLPWDAEDLAAARMRLAGVTCPDAIVEGLAGTAAVLGIGSLRAVLHAIRAARAAAALTGLTEVSPDAAERAVALVLAPRATRLPETGADAPPPDPPPPDDDADDEARAQQTETPPQDLLLEAARAAIPPDLLARLAAQGALTRTAGPGGGGGEDRTGNRRGRPAGTRRGDPRTGARLDLVQTLRSAAPWQPIRRKATGVTGRVLVTPDDFRIKRFREKTEKVVIFAVDASGSTALTRLAETKGAIELMLAEAYVRREQVALIAFRGEAAEILLPPTRSLVQAKRRLAGLPGGGGTPLAAGLEAGLALADLVRRQGRAPNLAVLTDGRANIARDGSPGRAQAGEDALALGRLIRAAGLPAIVIDTAPRPQDPAKALAQAMAGTYLPMPRADAHRIRAAMQAALSDA